MHKQVVVGMGTGRCGTASLCALLNQQPGTSITHEQYPLLPWQLSPRILAKKLSQISRRRADIVGDIANSWLPYVAAVLQQVPSAKFICLERDRAATVQSFIAKMKGRKNHWLEHDGRKWKRDHRRDPCFPKYDTLDMEEAIGLYWDDYYQQVNFLCEKFPRNVRKWRTEQALDSEQGVEEILSFIGVDKADQKRTVGIVRNRQRTRLQSQLRLRLAQLRNLLRPCQ
ncbi:MAG: hypothetical protein V3R51_03310 [Gammaproteobacteria bacterium]